MTQLFVPNNTVEPSRAKFMAGFNSGVRDAKRQVRYLQDHERAERTREFLVAYDLGLVFGKESHTEEETTAKINEAWNAYRGGVLV